MLKSVNIEGVEIHYDDVGEGDIVLLLHGWGCNTQTMASIAMFLEKQGKCVITLDFPGHGKSPEPPEPWSVTEYTELVRKFIENQAVEPCDIIAHSFGARVAIMLSAQYPELVNKMILTGAAGLIPKRSFKYYIKIYTYKLGKKIRKIKLLNKLFHLEERAKNKSVGSADYQATPPGMRPTFVRVVNQNLRPFLCQIKAPTLLIWGINDEATPLYFGKIMEKEIADCGLVVLENAGHYAFLDQPGKFQVITNAFLGGIAE